jgi:hypothetical protein
MKRIKYGGRVRSTPNRVTSDLRNFLSQYVQDNIQDSLEQLTPSRRAEMIVKLLPYILPTADKQQDEGQTLEPLVIIKTERCTTCDQLK